MGVKKQRRKARGRGRTYPPGRALHPRGPSVAPPTYFLLLYISTYPPNIQEHDFWNKRDPGDLEWTSRNNRGGHEAGGAPTPLGAPSTLVGPSLLHRPTSSSYIYSYTPKTSWSTTKTYFHRRNLLYPRDPILGPFPELRRRGH